MANIKSAKKRILVQAKREAQNKAFRTNLKTVIKRANAAIAANAEDKDVLVKAAVKKIDQACAKGIIHKNCAEIHSGFSGKIVFLLSRFALKQNKIIRIILFQNPQTFSVCGFCFIAKRRAKTMAHTETTLNSQTIFSGRIIEVKKDDIQLENGKKSIREVVVHHGGVCVAAIDQEDRLLLVRQFRYPYGKELLELPAGKIELGEDPRECGIRELQEECGCTADRFEKLAQLYPTPAYCTEVIHIYRASGLHESVQKLDDGEFLDVLRIPFAQAVQMVMDGEISDAKTQIGILKLHLLRQAEGK